MFKDKKLANDRVVQGKLSARLSAPSEITLIATVAVGFLVLHILVGVILLRTPANGSATFHQEAISSSYD